MQERKMRSAEFPNMKARRPALIFWNRSGSEKPVTVPTKNRRTRIVTMMGRSIDAMPKVLPLLMALTFGCCAAANAVTEVQGVSGEPQARGAARQHSGHTLEDRIRILTQWLNLDATQQAELRKVLEGQREQVRSLWSDTSVPAAYRISATQAISDKTGDQIRALLNEEQKKKFNPPRPPRDADSARPNVEDWMNAPNANKQRK
jgi:hypothetical protein